MERSATTDGEGTTLAELIGRLEDGLRTTMARLDEVPATALASSCRHRCARGGTVLDLLTHNIDHERMHAGQIVAARDALRRLQQDPKVRLAAELYVERARLIAALLGLDDADLDRAPEDGEWSIRENIEHVLFWEEDSMSDLIDQLRGA